MSRMYSAVFTKASVSASEDLFQLTAASTCTVVVHMVEVTQSSDAGDKQSEQIEVILHRGTTDGSGGSTPTPSPMEIGDAAAESVAETNNTSKSSEGVILWRSAFNVMAGLSVWFTPETRPVISPGGRLVVELTSTPADALDMIGTIVFEEIGGA